MSYHLVWNHGWEVWNDDGQVCVQVKWFPNMQDAMKFIDLCKVALLF